MLVGAEDEDAADGSDGCDGQLFKRMPRRSDTGNARANKVDAVIGEGPTGSDWELVRVVRGASDWELAIGVLDPCVLSSLLSRETPGILNRRSEAASPSHLTGPRWARASESAGTHIRIRCPGPGGPASREMLGHSPGPG